MRLVTFKCVQMLVEAGCNTSARGLVHRKTGKEMEEVCGQVKVVALLRRLVRERLMNQAVRPTTTSEHLVSLECAAETLMQSVGG